MEEFITISTPKTPEIKGKIENGSISIKGICIPEDARGFFSPFRNWLLDFTNTTDKEINLEVDLEYFNTSTSNILLDVFKHLNRAKESDSKEVKITWIYEEDDEEMKEVGEDYQLMIGDIITLQSKSILN
ncbi:MAG: hypothetical protein ACI857_001015 [Arenicella sp.]|jgi:hypothetical protein